MASTSDLRQERWKKHPLSPARITDIQNHEQINGCCFKPLSSVIYYAAKDDEFSHPHSKLFMFWMYYSYRLIYPPKTKLRLYCTYQFYDSLASLKWNICRASGLFQIPTQTHKERMEHWEFRTLHILYTKILCAAVGFSPKAQEP